jgi:hypothetical protein
MHFRTPARLAIAHDNKYEIAFGSEGQLSPVREYYLWLRHYDVVQTVSGFGHHCCFEGAVTFYRSSAVEYLFGGRRLSIRALPTKHTTRKVRIVPTSPVILPKPKCIMIRSISIVPLFGVFLLLFGFGPIKADEKDSKEKNVLIIGASSLRSPLHELVGAMLESNKTPMNVEPGAFGTKDLERRWNSGKVWDYVIMDAWQFTRGSTDSPEFQDATTAFVKRVRDHSPNCQIILFPWWLPGNQATNEDVMKVFHHCVEAAKPNDIWVATTGPAFMEARLARPDLRITVSKQDAHPGIHGAYINACSLFAILTSDSPVGLPATLKLRGHEKEFTIAEDDAKYLQNLAWNVYQRELKSTNPAKRPE